MLVAEAQVIVICRDEDRDVHKHTLVNTETESGARVAQISVTSTSPNLGYSALFCIFFTF